MDVQAAFDCRRDPASVMEAIAAAGIVTVLWARNGRCERVVEVLVEAGVTCVDFTLTSRGAVEALPGAFTPPRSCGPGGPVPTS